MSMTEPDQGLEVFLPGYPTFSAPRGSYVTIIGRSGVGKSRLCQALSGLVEDERERYVRLHGRELADIPLPTRSSLISYVPSDPYLSFSGLKGTVGGELDLVSRFSEAKQAVGSEDLEALVRSLGIADLLHRDPFSLSGGEAARASLAMALIKRPQLLVLDQMSDHLDAMSAAEIKQQMLGILGRDAVVIETHARTTPGRSVGLVDGWRIEVEPLEVALDIAADTQSHPEYASQHSAAVRGDGGALLQVNELSFRYERGGFGLGPVHLTVWPNERIAVVGRNGTGKTTLLRCLALLLRPDFKRFLIRDASGERKEPPPRREEHHWAKSALYCAQRAEDQLYLSTVRQELEDSAARLAGPEGLARALDFAARLGLEPHLEKSPFDLPRAQRRLIGLAAALAIRPPLLLLDEPTASLDDEQVSVLSDLLRKETTGSAVIFISHDAAFISMVATRRFEMKDVASYQGDDSKPALAPI